LGLRCMGMVMVMVLSEDGTDAAPSVARLRCQRWLPPPPRALLGAVALSPLLVVVAVVTVVPVAAVVAVATVRVLAAPLVLLVAVLLALSTLTLVVTLLERFMNSRRWLSLRISEFAELRISRSPRHAGMPG
ncbi:hypothetical protein KEM52_001786, partial [Ascosphaera acerosa]